MFHTVRPWRLAATATLLVASAPALVAQGFLCLEGGGDFSEGTWSQPVVQWCVNKAGASPDVLMLGITGSDNALENAFFNAGAGSVQQLNVVGGLANAVATADAVDDADIVWVRDEFTGVLVGEWSGSLLAQALRQNYLDGGVVGGSGEGAMVLGQYVFDASNGDFEPRDALEDAFSPQLSLVDDFLDIAPTLLVDADLTGSGRLPRLALLVARAKTDFGADALGVGLDDRTALVVEPDGTAEVLGEGSVTLLHCLPESMIHLAPGEAPTITDLRYLQLVAGYEVDLLAREVLARPPQAVLQGPPISSPIFASFNVNGSVESHSDFGDVKLDYGSGIDSLVLGAMNTLEADNQMLRTVVATNTWALPVFNEIKVGGIQYALSQHPHFLGLMLDTNTRLRATNDNTLIVREVLSGPVRSALVLDSFGVVSTAVSTAIHDQFASIGPRQSVALDDARLHVLKPGDAYDAEAHVPVLPDSQWLNVGQGLAGSQGVPLLDGTGAIVAFNPLTATLSNAQPFSAAFLVIGFSEVGAPLKAGTLVPSPDIISSALPTDATGSIAIEFLWPPEVPAGFDIYTQFWVDDLGAPVGFSASNGLVILPP